MTITMVRGGPERLTLRYIPLLAWLFIALTAYGVASLIVAVAAGQQALSAGLVFSLITLIALAVAAALLGGQLVVCHLDRGAGELRLVRYGLHGRAALTRPLAEVVGLEIHVLRRAQYRVTLRLRSGERLPLTPYYLLAFGSGGLDRLSAILGLEPELIQRRASLRP